MVANFHIYRAANLLIAQHGADVAKLGAAQRADQMRSTGNRDGLRTWTQILRAINELSAAANVTIH